MPRQPRLDAPGLLQHVMARGIERRKLFRDDKDRNSFLDRLAIILEETQTQCYAWALIPNHFHLLLRTGPTPLSKVMRRLMTGYAVTFNKRHKRSGHLFQNRYKSVVCEEDPYLLELIRYIHLNPLRAKLVKALKELEKYPWTGHSAILGRLKNPLIPKIRDRKSGIRNQDMSNQVGNPNSAKEATPSVADGLFFQFRQETEKDNKNQRNPRNPCQKTSLAEKTIEDILLHFAETKRVAIKRYREFVEKGIKQGTREDLQGGGLVRSAGGDASGLLGRKAEEREKGDARVLGSGDFVSTILDESNKIFEKRNFSRPTIKAIIDEVISHFDISPTAIYSRSRNGQLSKARSVVSYLAVEKAGYAQKEVGTELNVSRIAVRNSLLRGETNLDMCNQIWAKIG